MQAVLIILCVAAMGGSAILHFWWRRRYRETQALAARDTAALQQQHQQAILKLQARQKVMFNSMVEGLLVLDRNGRVQLANRVFRGLFNVSGEFTGRTILELLRWPELADLIHTLGDQQPWVDRELKFPGQAETWFQVSAAAIRDADPEDQGTLLVFHDVSRLKRLERTREEFVGNVSHELRTPLSHIKGYAETLLSGAKDDPEVATRFLQTIERNAERLRLLIEDLLTISELESGRVRLNLQDVALRGVINGVFNDFRARAAGRSVTLSNQVPDLAVRADFGRLEQVVSNFVDNAIKYGKPGGTVTASARALESGKVEVAIQDDGPGLPAEALERVFERFYRVDKARSRDQGGTGLGLSIVKHLVQSHGGRVWAESSPGRGAKFFFTLLAANKDDLAKTLS